MNSSFCRSAFTALVLVASTAAYAGDPVRLHPDNPRYFLFRGKPLALVTATEHYGSVINRPFDFEKYLDDAAAHKMTLTRTFLLFRELQSARNPSSPCKPEWPDYIAPFPRTGPGKAMDGEPIYDLDQWNPEYFDRLHRFLDAASKRGIVVELTVFSNTYADNVWALNPFRSKNNKQGIGNVEWPDYLSLKDKELVRRQTSYARKIIDETSQYDNVYYEICNEPGGGVAGHEPPADVDAWQEEMVAAMRDEMRKLNRPHLISGQEAFTYTPQFRFPLDKTFATPMVDIVNVHPLPGTVLGGHSYQMGNFMSKELMLSEVADFCRAAYRQRKPVVLDEDNTASMYRDRVGWTIHRKRAWSALLNGAHYDYIDFSITVGSEAGTPGSRGAIRSWMKHLSEFMAGFDYVHSKPTPDWIKAKPEKLAASILAAGDRDYAAYLADSREVTDTTAGQPISGKVEFTTSRGRYAVRLYSPVTGQYSPAMIIEGGGPVSVQIGPFEEDIVIRATRVGP
jgi:hypothetical protein